MKVYLKIMLVFLVMAKFSYAKNIIIYNDTNFPIHYQQSEDHDFVGITSYGGTIQPQSSQTIGVQKEGKVNYSHAIENFNIDVNNSFISEIGLDAYMYPDGWSMIQQSTAILQSSQYAISLFSASEDDDSFYFIFEPSGKPNSQAKLCNINYGCHWRLTKQQSGNIVPYYPAGCSVGVNCSCVQDAASGDIWDINGDTHSGWWSDWCSANPNDPGYDAKCATSTGSSGEINGSNGGASLAAVNGVSKCGLTGGWHLPTVSNKATVGSNIIMYQNNNIGHLASIALSNGYLSGNNLGEWMNNNGFNSVNNEPVAAPYWLSNSNGAGSAFGIGMNNGNILSSDQNLEYGVMLVHENN